MSVQTEIGRLHDAKSAIAAAIADKGVTVPDGTKLDGMAELIAGIEAGGDEYKESLKGLIDRTAVNIVFPDDLTNIGDYSFRDCSYLGYISLPDGIKTIGRYAFSGCSRFDMLSLPNSLEDILDYAFSYCYGLTIKKIPASVKNISIYSFNGTYITELTFLGKPKWISFSAFNNCSKLATINVPWAEGEVADAPWGAVNATINYNYVSPEV